MTPPPRRAMRVHELAAELGVPSKTVLATLKDLGAFVRSASSLVDQSAAQRLRQKLRMGHSSYETTATESAGTQAVIPDVDVPQAPPLVGLAKTLRGTFLQLQSDEEASRLAAAWTSDGLFTDHDVIAWCRAGLSPRDHAQARQLHAHGVRPDHLDLVLRGKSVKSLLRGGQSVARVVGLLRQHGYVAP